MRKPVVRSPAQIKKARDALVAYIADHPSKTIGEIAKGVGKSADEIRRDMERLIEAQTIQYDGAKRYKLVTSTCLLADLLTPPPPAFDWPSRKILLTDLPAQRVDPKRTTLSIGSSMGIDYVKYGGPT